jgi:hypothetical protein
MRKYQLMGGAALVALALSPLPAFAQSAADIEDEIGDANEVRPEGIEYGLRGTADISYENEIETEIETDIDFTKDVVIAGTVSLTGTVVTDAAAVAVVDNKQVLVGNTLEYTEENELNGENGWVSAVFGQGVSESGQDPNDNATDGVVQPQIRVGFFAPVLNTVNAFSVDVAGNVGLNFGAGNYNVQENIAALASSNFEGDDADTGGLAEASLTALQLAVDNSIGANEDEVLDEDDPESGGGGNNFRVRNTVFGGPINVEADGNLGINAVAGAMNTQKNALVMAVATDSAMAEATAGVIQASVANYLEVQDEINVVNPGAYTGAGNLGVNLAAGSYNQQMNSLVAAVGLAGAGNGGGTPTPPPPPPPPSDQS